MDNCEQTSRRKFIGTAVEGGKVVGGAIVGAGILKAAEMFVPPEKIVGGVWTKHEVTNGMLILEAEPNANGDGLVKDVTFTIERSSAPDFQVNNDDPHQYPLELGGWIVLGTKTPNPEGLCSIEVPISQLGQPSNGLYKVSFDTYGFDKKTGQQTTESINYSPDEKEVPSANTIRPNSKF